MYASKNTYVCCKAFILIFLFYGGWGVQKPQDVKYLMYMYTVSYMQHKENTMCFEVVTIASQSQR